MPGVEILTGRYGAAAMLLMAQQVIDVASRPILRVGEGIAALTPHRPERAQLTHSVLHSTGWRTIRSGGG
jgi:hypothetical protein